MIFQFWLMLSFMACNQVEQETFTPSIAPEQSLTTTVEFSHPSWTPSPTLQLLIETKLPDDTAGLSIPTKLPSSTPTEIPFLQDFDDLIQSESEQYKGKIAQAGYFPVVVNINYPDAVNSYRDLDTGSCCSRDRSDLKFGLYAESGLVIEIINGAIQVRIEAAEASLNECSRRREQMSATPIYPSKEVGSYFCFYTSDQRISLLHIDKVQLDPQVDATVRFSFVTWDQNFFIEN